ncbi:MAG: 6-phosphogluconolactonase, partial [Longimicrobiales bacterium]
PRWRVTLTLAALRSARRLVVLATGEDKAEIVGSIFRRHGRVPPAGLLSSTDGVTWVLDTEAAAKLPGPHAR